MSSQGRVDRVLQELCVALAQADATDPPPSLRTRVLIVAASERGPGRPFQEPPAITPVEAYRRTVEAFSTLLSTLGDGDWAQPVLRDLTVQQLVGHLLGVERAFQVVIGLDTSGTAPSEHVAGTQATALAQNGRPPDETHQEWLEEATRTIRYLDAAGPAAWEEPVALHRLTLPVGAMLIVRSFETWIHEEDIRRATGRPLLAPDPSRLSLMTDLAVGGLPRALGLRDQQPPRRTARLVLTGAGGGTWQTALDRGEVGATADVRIVVDATSFCRLVGNRLTPDEVHATISGDELLGRQILASVTSLALD